MSSLARLDCTITFGAPGPITEVVVPSVSSQTAVGTVAVALSGAFGATIFAADHLAAVKTAVTGGGAPQSAAYAALGTVANGWSGHANNLTALANYYTAHSLQGSLSTFACPGYYYDPTDGLAIQDLVNADMSAAVSTALYGFLSNQNAPTAQSIVRAWTTTITSISQAPNPTGDNANDAPLIAGTLLNGLVLAACLFDEGLRGNWPGLSGWTTTDRANVETWVQTVYYGTLQTIAGIFISGLPASGMANNWRSWALYGSALCAFYLLGSETTSVQQQGADMMATVTSQLTNAISGTVPEGGTVTNPPTGTQTNAIVQTEMVYTGVSPSVTMQPGELFLEDLRGADSVHYNYYSLLPLCAAAQVLQAAGGTNLFTSQAALLQQALTQELSRLSPLESGQNSDLPFTPELYEAMGAVFQSSTYAAYAIANRPVMPNASGVFQHISVFFAATLTSLLNPLQS